MPSPVRAQELQAAPALVPAAELAPLTVSGVVVDKTAENSVVARDLAIAEARKTAFQKLAERNMSPEQFKEFVFPDDQTITTLVQDFEIDSEQLSATRYVASFTVRFREGVRNYVEIRPSVAEAAGAGVAVGADAGEGGVLETSLPAAPGMAGLLSKPLLILPYFEDISGRTLLWEDPNPWREAWQGPAPVLPQGAGPLLVPLGDIGDIGAGGSNAVWSGDYSAVETLRKNYNAENVVLAVANKSGPSMAIDIYAYAEGRLQRLGSLTPYVGTADEPAAFRQGILDVLGFLQKSASASPVLAEPEGIEGISRALISRKTQDEDIRWESGWSKPAMPEASVQTMPEASGSMTPGASVQTTPGASVQTTPEASVQMAPEAPVETTATTAAVSGKTVVQATMAFEEFPQWVEMQKRLAAVTPRPQIDIKALDRSGARFTIEYAGSVVSLKQALEAQGVALGDPAVEVGISLPGRPDVTQKEIYDLRLTH